MTSFLLSSLFGWGSWLLCLSLLLGGGGLLSLFDWGSGLLGFSSLGLVNLGLWLSFLDFLWLVFFSFLSLSGSFNLGFLLLDVLGEDLVVLGSIFLLFLVVFDLLSLIESLPSESLFSDESLDLW